MKKFLFILISILISIGSYSQRSQGSKSYWFSSEKSMYKYRTEKGWSKWSLRNDKRVAIEFDMSSRVATFRGRSVLIYDIIDIKGALSNYIPMNEYIGLKVINKNDEYGFIKIKRDEKLGLIMHVDFPNKSWVYMIERIY